MKQDKDIDVRMAAAEALGKINSPDSIKALAVALEDRAALVLANDKMALTVKIGKLSTAL